MHHPSCFSFFVYLCLYHCIYVSLTLTHTHTHTHSFSVYMSHCFSLSISLSLSLCLSLCQCSKWNILRNGTLVKILEKFHETERWSKLLENSEDNICVKRKKFY